VEFPILVVDFELESMVCPYHAAAPTKVLVDIVEYSEDSEHADADSSYDG